MEEGWERPRRVALDLDLVRYLVEPAFAGSEVTEFEVLETGLANTNVCFCVEGASRTRYVLRLHTRDPSAAEREKSLASLLAGGPKPTAVPRLVYSDTRPERGEHPYSIWGFVEGALLQDLFRTLPESELVQVAAACGEELATLTQYRFSRCGEFGPGLCIGRDFGAPSEFVPKTIHRSLFEGAAGTRLGAELRDALWSGVEKTSPLLPELDGDYVLVHADYKRSNLLLRPSDVGWAVTAVLDWEFACAGPPLIDVGIFLRAGAALPRGFRDAFVSGYRNAGGRLPSEWLRLSRLLDVVSQMTFLDDFTDRPRVIAETTEVVRETISILA